MMVFKITHYLRSIIKMLGIKYTCILLTNIIDVPHYHTNKLWSWFLRAQYT